MADGLARAGAPDDRPDVRERPESTTRGFLFADLRGYTEFVEAHGAATAASLLLRYRSIVRQAIERFSGAEIKTEGDSFYVVFSSVSSAVRCGLAISEDARGASIEHPEEPIRVGVGIHAGETIETADGYVGSPVNLAARICAQAGAGEVLVSDTVRALTQTLLPARFVPRGRRRLKGVVEPVALFAVVPMPSAEGIWGGTPATRWWPRNRASTAVGIGLLALGAVAIGAFALRGPAAGELPPGPWRIGVALPLTGDAGVVGEDMLNAVQLAIDDANAAGGIGGAVLELRALDTAGTDGGESGARAATNATELVSDPRVVAMVGPFQSNVAVEQIPITNAAGLLQCGPSNTDPSLTVPGAGAIDLRSAAPERINYVRLAALADLEARGAASFAVNDLGAEHALVIDDTDAIGREIADAFQAAFNDLGGFTTRRALNPDADPATVLQPLDAPDAPDLVYFGGFTYSGAPQVRKAMVEAGHADVDFVSWEGILDYITPTFVDQAGEAAIGTYASQPGVGTISADFEVRFRAAYDAVPEGPALEYVAAAHACAQVIIESLREVAAQRPSAEALREAVRAYAVDPAHRFTTVVGDVSFDANGDNTRQYVTIYRVVAAERGDPGNWAIVKQLDFGSAQ
jgi:class 3 adenylate cyclase/ABC-type branched-subunit amino acid transport system substrate-binding protein